VAVVAATAAAAATVVPEYKSHLPPPPVELVLRPVRVYDDGGARHGGGYVKLVKG